MNNPFSLEKGMEVLEQGANSAKQQAKTTTQSVTTQITGQQTTSQQQNNPTQPVVLDGFKAQIMGESGQAPSAPKPDAQATQKSQNDFMKDLYGPSDQNQAQQPEATLNPENMAAKAAEDQQKQLSIKHQLENYFNPEIEQKMTQLRHQRVEEKKEEEQVEEQEKMQELQAVEKQKEEDMALKRQQYKAEIKGGGGG